VSSPDSICHSFPFTARDNILVFNTWVHDLKDNPDHPNFRNDIAFSKAVESLGFGPGRPISLIQWAENLEGKTVSASWSKGILAKDIARDFVPKTKRKVPYKKFSQNYAKVAGDYCQAPKDTHFKVLGFDRGNDRFLVSMTEEPAKTGSKTARYGQILVQHLAP
jgi:hypothetical protein